MTGRYRPMWTWGAACPVSGDLLDFWLANSPI
jgi:hypothetical protein